MKADSIILVTGATGGIGQALVRAYLDRGASVVLAGRKGAQVDALAGSLGAAAMGVVLDVTDEDSISSALAHVEKRFGAVNVLVNNAGIAVSAPLRKGPEWAETHMNVNYHGPRRMLEAVLPGMLAAGKGQVLQIASSAGLFGYAYTSAYCASKHALIGYSRAAALELREKGIGVSMICPHFVDSPMTDASVARIQETTSKNANEARATLAAMNPDAVLVDPDQIALLAVQQLGSSQSGMLWELTGSEIHCRDQGFSL